MTKAICDKYPKDTWIRTCQECLHIQSAPKTPNINEQLTEAYKYTKCRKCHSPAMDYGLWNYYIEDSEDD